MSDHHWLYITQLDQASMESALQQWLGEGAEHTLLAFVAEADKAVVPTLQAICRGRGQRLLGAIFPAVIQDGQMHTKGIVFLNIEGEVFHRLESELGDMQQVDRLAATLKAQLDPQGSQRRSLFLLFDAMVGNVASILERLYLRLADTVDYAGACAGSETFEPMPCLFDQERIIGNGLLAMLLPMAGEALLSHGYRSPEDSMMITSADGNRIAAIDWQPAFDAYRQLAKRQFDVEITPDNFYQYGVHMPFGLLQANGDVIVRIPVAIHEDGSLFCVGEVPENAILVLLDGPVQQLQAGAEALARRLHSAPSGGIFFYCAGRRMHLGEAQVQRELDTFSDQGMALSGALSLGEIGALEESNYPAFHNATLIYCPVGTV